MKDSAVLLIDCPDRKGLVARVSGLLYEHGANILHADQHQDHELGLFFMRVELAELDGVRRSTTQASAQHSTPLAARARHALEADARWRSVRAWRSSVSQYLHCLADLLHRWRTGELDCEIPLIVSQPPRTSETLAAVLRRPVSSTCR